MFWRGRTLTRINVKNVLPAQPLTPIRRHIASENQAANRPTLYRDLDPNQGQPKTSFLSSSRKKRVIAMWENPAISFLIIAGMMVFLNVVLFSYLHERL